VHAVAGEVAIGQMPTDPRRCLPEGFAIHVRCFRSARGCWRRLLLTKCQPVRVVVSPQLRDPRPLRVECSAVAAVTIGLHAR
jgi:hypothetical protein